MDLVRGQAARNTAEAFHATSKLLFVILVLLEESMHYSLRAHAFAVIFLGLASHSLHAQGSSRAFNEKAPTVPLSDVIAATESALDDYQTYAKSPAGIKDGLPPLATADFDFKTVVDTKGGISINLFIFTIGASHEKQQTNDLDFTYMPHVEPPSKTLNEFFSFDGGKRKEPKTLYQDIIDTLKESAAEIKKAQDVANKPSVPGTTKLDLCQLSLTLSFGVTTDVQGGIKAPIQMVTLTASLDRSKNNVQQVKLTFKVKDPKNLSCVPPK
jgi:hypothetical protein